MAIGRLSVSAEWISVWTREAGEDEVENKEAAWTTELAFELTDSVELAGRYEGFYDDCSGKQDEVLDDRMGSRRQLSIERMPLPYLIGTVVQIWKRTRQRHRKPAAHGIDSNCFEYETWGQAARYLPPQISLLSHIPADFLPIKNSHLRL